MKVTFFVPGEPRGKGRPRFNRSTGTAYTDRETKAYEETIVAFFRKAYGGFRYPDAAFLSISVTALLPIPKSTTKAQRAAMASGETLPSRKPDVDNVQKVALDALSGVAYKDDARVVDLHGYKRYSMTPGVLVEIEEIGGTE